MRAAIITSLKTKFEGVSETILGRVADKLISSGKVKTVDDVADAVAGVTFQQVLEHYGDSRADEAQKTAVKNYEAKYKIKDGKALKPDNGANEQPGGGGTGTETGTDTGNVVTSQQQDEKVPAWAQAIIESNKRFNERLDRMDQEKTTKSRQSQLADILKDAPQSVRSRYEKDFARMTFKDDDEFSGWLTELTPDIQQMSADFNAKGGTVGRPKGGSHGGGKADETNPFLQARVKAREKAEPSAPAIQGLTPNP